MQRTLEIICVGNELLTGHTLNTNAHWMAKKLTDVGGIVRRIAIVRDEIEEIVSSINESLERKPRWIIISGGLGPTYDDKTLQGLAKALRQRLVVNKEAVAMLRRKYMKAANPILTPSRYKMATMPRKAKPLENSVGHAPAVMVKHGSCTIFALPGVPKEMEAIFSKHVLPAIKKGIGNFVRMEVTLETRGIMESVLAPYLDIVVANNPDVYIKSHPKDYEDGMSTLHINISAEARNKTTARIFMERATEQMKLVVINAGGRVKRI